MDFGQALNLLRAGFKVARTDWNAAGQWVALQVPDDHSKMRRPYLYLRPVDGNLVPWAATQSDVLAEDWKIAESD
jgi:hypothetical protein